MGSMAKGKISLIIGITIYLTTKYRNNNMKIIDNRMEPTRQKLCLL